MSSLPIAKKALQSQNPEKVIYLEANKTKEMQLYKRHSGPERNILNNTELVYVRNILQNV